MVRVISAEAAAELIPSDSNVTVTGLVGNMVPEMVLQAIEQRFLATGAPRDITEIHPWLYGGPDGTGLNRWAHPGLLKRIIGSTYILPILSKTSEINQMIIDDQVEGHCWPANAIFQLLRSIGAGRPGYMTDVGIDTFADPRRHCGRLNDRAKDDLIKLIDFEGTEQLFYPSMPINVAIIRASVADQEGNLTCEDEGLTQGIMVQATAARNSGGIVIAEVRRVVETGCLDPLMVEVPGVLVDYVVVNENARQTLYTDEMTQLDATTGRRRMPPPEFEYPPPSAEKVIARRALMEISPGDIVNVGAGNSSGIIPRVSMEEHLVDKVRWTVEHGAFGGLPFRGGMHWNPTAIMTPAWLLDWYNGGGLDQTFVTLPQVDRFGHVNNVRLGNQLPCPGGFVDITYHTKKVTFCGTMTRDGFMADVTGGELKILQEGCTKRFVQDVEMVAFSGQQAIKHGQDVLYITERAVFRLTPEGLVMEEIAPGVDCRRDVLDQSEFPIQVSPDLKLMDSRLFQIEPLFLGLEM